MSKCVFPDNIVLCNFAAVDWLGLLESVLDGYGRWTEAVQVGDEEDTALRLEATRRAVFGGMEPQPLKHLGEAPNLLRDPPPTWFAGAWWISDDQDAVEYARFQDITTRETIDVMAMAIARGDIARPPSTAFELMLAMAEHRRALRLLSREVELQ